MCIFVFSFELILSVIGKARAKPEQSSIASRLPGKRPSVFLEFRAQLLQDSTPFFALAVAFDTLW